jgi:hypothetical protein
MSIDRVTGAAAEAEEAAAAAEPVPLSSAEGDAAAEQRVTRVRWRMAKGRLDWR